MKKFFNDMFVSSIFSSLLFLFVGLFLLFAPSLTISLIAYIVGLFILIPGILGLVNFFRDKNNLSCVYGIISVLAAIIIILNPSALASIIPLMLGFWLVVNGFFKIKYSFILRSNKRKWLGSFVISVVIVIGGFVLLLNPFKTAIVITTLIGIYMVLYAILDIVNAMIVKKNVDDFVEIIR